VGETPEQFYERVADELRMPPVNEWETFPFEGDMRPRALLPPLEEEVPRKGEGGIDCWRCAMTDDDCIWTNEHWRLNPLSEPYGLPVIVILAPRRHFSDVADLPEDLAAELGPLVGHVERAVYSVGHIGRVHICKWVEGSEHMHWWFMARPARLPQLVGSFAAVWNEVLPPLPEAVRSENLAAVAAALEE
jgi:diadenosine tetraphosphate (Ap4A) HIT family hydrolase